MKYSIEGLKDSEVIKSIKTIKNDSKKAIEVSYLNGERDIVDFNKETMDKIIGIMMEHAKEFVKDKEKQIEKVKTDQISKILLGVIIDVLGLGLVVLPLPIWVTILGALLILISYVSFSDSIRLDQKIKDLGKYDLYLNEVQKDIEKYREIINKEIDLGAEKDKTVIKNSKLENISMLDNYSLNDLKKIKEKVERYTNLMDNKEISSEDISLVKEESEKQKTKKIIKK